MKGVTTACFHTDSGIQNIIIKKEDFAVQTYDTDFTETIYLFFTGYCSYKKYPAFSYILPSKTSEKPSISCIIKNPSCYVIYSCTLISIPPLVLCQNWSLKKDNM